MSDAVLIAIVTGSVTIIVTIATLFVNYKIERIHRQINSRMDELLKINKSASRAEGVLEGKEASKKDNM